MEVDPPLPKPITQKGGCMKVLHFQELNVWQKAHQLTLEIYNLTGKYPQEEKFGLISQIRRSSASICANLAEGYKKSTKEFSRFIDIAEGSLEETKYHLILSKDLQYCDLAEFERIYNLACEVGRMLNGLGQRLHS